MMSKRTKEHKDIQDEAISKDDFLDMFNRLTKIEMDMKKMGERRRNSQGKR